MNKKIIKTKTAPKKELKIEKPIKKRSSIKQKQKTATVQTFGLHNLKAPRGSHKPRKILGRGSSSGHGKTSTRGSKGQTSRAGRHFYAGFEGGQTPLIRRMPKRGFTNIFKKEFQIVNLDDLNRIKETTINPALLEEKGLIKDKEKPVKILADGKIKNAVTVKAHAFSKKACQEISSAGGKIEIINV